MDENEDYTPEHAAPEPTKQPVAVSNNVYDKMKSFLQLVGPAIITFYLFMGQALKWENVETYAGIGTAFLTMPGVVGMCLSGSFPKSDAPFDG